LKIRFYIGPQIGSGTVLNPYRSLLNDFIHIENGEWFTEIDNPARRISICCVVAEQTTHTAIATDSRVIICSPLADDKADMKTKLENTFNSIAGAAALKVKLEAIGIDTSWIGGSDTLRLGLRYLLRVFTVGQFADGESVGEVREFLKANLTTQVSAVPAVIRDRVKTWMQNKGLAVGWITGTTTVRQVIHYIVTNLNIGKLNMSDEEF